MCLCYINTEIGQELEDEENNEETEYASNFVAVGSITNEIQIWVNLRKLSEFFLISVSIKSNSVS